ncbi:serine/threonine protein kinase SCH9, partial [Ascoidea rubescens DSM 1968]
NNNFNHNRPIYTRQSSNQYLTNDYYRDPSNPKWKHEAIFDISNPNTQIEISVYDSVDNDRFLGYFNIHLNLAVLTEASNWYTLKPRNNDDHVTGKVQIKYIYTTHNKKRKYGPEDFQILKMLGKGTFGQVYLALKKDNNRVYAMKTLSKNYIAKKKEIAHTLSERDILVKASKGPFIINLKFAFQTPDNLYFVTDYMAGGELFYLLQKEKKFTEERTKFYVAELLCALEILHNEGVIYRDLKPENILLDANGHIALCDFGLSKLNIIQDHRAKTFCGTTEYLAPEILLDESGYTKMVDFWSLGVLIFEMICGWSPFYAETNQQMYKNIAYGRVRFPRGALSPEGRQFVKGLLNRNPVNRLGSNGDVAELKAQPFFSDIDWNLLVQKKIPPPYKPPLRNETDVSNFDPEFTQTTGSAITRGFYGPNTPLSPNTQANFNGFTYVGESTLDDNYGSVTNKRKSLYNVSRSLIPGNPNLPPEEDVIDDDLDYAEEDEHQLDQMYINHMDLDDAYDMDQNYI